MKRRDFLAGGLAGGVGLAMGGHARAQARGTIRFLTPETDPSQVKVWQELITRYTEANRGAAVQPEYASWDDLIRKIPADLMAGRPPEIVAGSSRVSFMAAAAKRNLLVDLAPLVDQIGRADFHAPSLKAWHLNGIQAAIPYGVQWPVLWCRTDLFQEAGLELPKTWDEYRAAAEKLTNPARGMFGACFPAGRTWNTQIQATIAIWGAGGRMFDDKLNPTFDTPEIRRAMTYYAEMCRFSPPDIGQYGFREASAAYTSGKAATTFYWGRVLSHLYQQAPDLLPKSKTVHIPHGGTPATALGWDEFVVYKSRNTNAALDYVKFMLEPQHMFMMMEPVIAHVVPTRTSVMPMVERHDWVQKHPDIVRPLIEPIDFGISATQETPDRPFNYKWDAIEARNIIPDMVQRIVLGKEPVNIAVEKAQKEAVDATKDLRP
ncbi:ABC transporter substrate-binding protein [Roseicella aerolata]|uniref:Sugar ABC transporter substrate-binding protein n=1 Tax=Roseicella aerolata TaxID=2883479 RepID=A0A9X1LA77_9PROT|nr:sugar ABC transporter substrate-binding protein [Roseicella aerolata]MCB4824514.1 sugar ABC transporter substrate-binding protein [Roseicella aerolata]